MTTTAIQLSNIEKWLKLYSAEKYSGGHNVHTPMQVCDSLLNNITFSANTPVVVIYNVELVVSLVLKYNIDANNIYFVSDHINKDKLANRLGVTTIAAKDLDILKLTRKPVLLINPPYTNGESSADEIYTSIIDHAIDVLDPIAIGAVNPENLMYGGAKKAKLRNRLQTKYAFKSIKFLNQKIDWNGAIKVATVAWVAEEGYTGPITVTGRYSQEVYTVKKSERYFNGETQVVADWIASVQTESKVILSVGKKTNNNGPELKISLGEPDSVKVIDGKEFVSDNTKWRVAFGYMRGNTCAVVQPGISIPAKYRYTSFKSETEARKFAKYMLSEAVRGIMKLTYNSRTLDNPQLSFVPLIDLSNITQVNDAAVYQALNASDDVQQALKKLVSDEIPF